MITHIQDTCSAGILYPHGDCNDTARKRQERLQDKRSLKRTARDVGATPQKRKSPKKDVAPSELPVKCVETFTVPEASEHGASTPSGEPSQRKRPRTKKARLEAKRSQGCSQPSQDVARTPAHSQQLEQREESQIETPATQLHSLEEPSGGSGQVQTAVGADLPSQPTPSQCATPQVKRPRTQKARLEMKRASALASQTPSAQIQACTSPDGQTQTGQVQQENIAFQPGDPKHCMEQSTPSAKLHDHMQPGPGQDSPQLQPMDGVVHCTASHVVR